MKVALLNSPVLTAYGLYSMTATSPEGAKALVRSRGFTSAIGHRDTARIISELLGIDCPENRIRFTQAVGQAALVFRLNQRPPEGKILNRAEIDSIGFSWAFLERFP